MDLRDIPRERQRSMQRAESDADSQSYLALNQYGTCFESFKINMALQL
jgi:hypothetical protein